jgi:hypothetical protein
MRRSNALILATLLACAGIQAASAEESCPVSAAEMMSKAAMTKSLQDRGYTQIRSLSTHNGCYEAKGLDKNGKRFELELNGHTGDIVNAE